VTLNIAAFKLTTTV